MQSLLGQKKKKVYCRTCKSETFHKLFGVNHRVLYYDDDFLNFDTSCCFHSEMKRNEFFKTFPAAAEIHEYRLLACEGCNTAVLEEAIACRELNWWKDDDSDDDPRLIWCFLYYPSVNYSTRQPQAFEFVNNELNEIYREIIDTFNYGAYTLCAMGLRALLEAICVDRGITDKRTWQLSEKLKMLKQDNHIPESAFEGLMHFKFLGDNAAHRLLKPEREEISIALDLIESLLSYIYESKTRLESSARKMARIARSSKSGNKS